VTPPGSGVCECRVDEWNDRSLPRFCIGSMDRVDLDQGRWGTATDLVDRKSSTHSSKSTDSDGQPGRSECLSFLIPGGTELDWCAARGRLRVLCKRQRLKVKENVGLVVDRRLSVVHNIMRMKPWAGVA
jgi:hypothetical protein